METNSFNDWINQIANKNGYIELADNTEVIEDIGFWVRFEYPSGEKSWEFIFHEEIQN